jgi:hypothetical protein
MEHGYQASLGPHPSRAELRSLRRSGTGCRIILQIRGLYPAEILYLIGILRFSDLARILLVLEGRRGSPRIGGVGQNET